MRIKEIRELFPESLFIFSPEYRETTGNWQEQTDREVEDGLASFCVFVSPESSSKGNYQFVAVRTSREIPDVKRLYSIEPTFVVDNDIWLFRLQEYIDKKSYESLSKSLAFVLAGDVVDAVPIDGSKKFPSSDTVSWEHTSKRYADFTRVVAFHNRVKSHSPQTVKGMTISNIGACNRSRSINIEKVTTAIGDIDAVIDDTLNIVADLEGACGDPFFYTLAKKSFDLTETMAFFNEHFDSGFKLERDEDEEEISGVIQSSHTISGGSSFQTNSTGYFISTEKGDKQITDFFIDALYKFTRQDGTMTYVVRLVNPELGVQTPPINWKNSFRKADMMAFFAAYGPYHFKGADNQIIAMHTALGKAPIPFVKEVRGFGFHEDALILENGMFNLKTKTLMESDEDYVFNDDGQGYIACYVSGKPLAQELKIDHPKFPKSRRVIPAKQVWDFFESIYSKDIGLQLLCYMWGMLAHGALSHDFRSQKYLGLFTHGIRGSGKTELHGILRRAFGMSPAPMNFTSTSSFVFTAMASHMKLLPVSLGEYRESGTRDIETRWTRMRNMFDKAFDNKGKSDQGIVNYELLAHFVVEGEERISDAATRSRCMNLTMSKEKTVKREGFDFMKEVSTSIEIQQLLFSYLMEYKHDKAVYDKYVAEGMKIFDVKLSRIAIGYALIYAGAMMVLPEKRDRIIEILLPICQAQDEEQIESAGHRELVRAIGRAMGVMSTQPFEIGYHDGKESVKFSVARIMDYFNRARVKLTLSIDTYLDYMRDAGIVVDFCDFQGGFEECIVFPIDSSYPKELRGHMEINAKFLKATK